MVNAELGTVLLHVRKLAAADSGRERSDWQLLDEFTTSRNEDAFLAIVRRHGPMVKNVCQHVLHQLQDAEDAFQATFLVLARNARTIRKRDGLASWLHGVAYRMAKRTQRDAARRRLHESQAKTTPQLNPEWTAAWREVQALLDEEIERLPEKYRAVFVLCCLGGKSRSDVAGELGLKEGTVWSRLAQARRILQQRLARRGVTLSVVLGGLALSETSARAVVSTGAARATARAAVAYHAGKLAAEATVSSRIIALADSALTSVLATKLKVATVLLLALGLSVGAAAALTRQQNTTTTALAAKNEPSVPVPVADKPRGNAALQEHGDQVTVSGRVLDPDGRPFAGAEVSLGWYYGYAIAWFPPIVKPFKQAGAVSGADGRFRLTFTKAESYAALRNGFQEPWRHTQVVVSAKGFGPGWAWLQSSQDELTIRLARDDVPIHGRLLDLQGRPVAGASVRFDHLTSGQDYLTLNTWTGLLKTVTTDRAGRFVLRGVGRDRDVHLHIDGASIEHKLVQVNTSGSVNAKPVNRVSVEVVAGPTKPITGTIRDKDTGEPLAGCVVYGNAEKYRAAVFAITDAHGRYRLTGLPKAGSYQLDVRPQAGQNYLSRVWHIPDSEGLKPITADFPLRRGVPVRFRLIDRQTSRPVRGAVLYGPLQDNPLYRESEDHPGLFPNRLMREFQFPDKGHYFNLLAYPGPGVIFTWVKSGNQPYLPARVAPADRKKGYYPYGGKDPLTMGYLELCEGYRIIDPDGKDKSLEFTIEVNPGRTRYGTLLGPDGKPVTGATAFGLGFSPLNLRDVAYRLSSETQALDSESFTVTGLDPQADRIITFVHKGRKLIGHQVINGADAGPITVRLRPWGSLTGRLVVANGKPLAKVQVKAWHGMPAPGIWPPNESGGEVETGPDGRFRLDYLDSTLMRELRLNGDLSGGDQLKNLAVRPGETRDLGDILVQVTPAKKGK